MMYPPGLPADVKARAFRARNGELGILPGDVPAFLDACKADDAKVLGWELWIIDHSWGIETNDPVPAPGYWCGGLPLQGRSVPGIFGGEGNVEETAKQLAALDLAGTIQPAWLPFVRVNFTLAG